MSLSLTQEQAWDETLTMLKAGFDGSSSDAVLYFDEVPADREDDGNSFIKVSFQLGESRQAGFGSVGNRMFSRMGNLRCEIHALAGKGLLETISLVKVIADSFEGKHSPGGVWFQSLNAVDMGRDGAFHITDVAVFFTFDEIK
jgi:hypothetical protein